MKQNQSEEKNKDKISKDETSKERKAKEKIIFFDTTLRDGEQSPGCAMTLEEKMKIAHALKEMNVDVIEAGFAVSSPQDYEAIRQISTEVGTKDGPIICSLARAVDYDIKKAVASIESASKQRIHTFVATSEIHMKKKLRKTKEQVVEMAVRAVEKAKRYVEDVEFSLEDFGRTDNQFAVEVINAAIDAGATTINMPDTVGFLNPWQIEHKVGKVISDVRSGGREAIFSTHCHNDRGLATANTIAAMRSGARQVEVTVNGIGERAGNTAIEEIIANVIIDESLEKRFRTDIEINKIGPISKLVQEITGNYVQWNKPIVGRNAFAHESGIHQDGVIKEKGTYEIFNHKVFNVETHFPLGRKSGKSAVIQRFKEIGIEMDAEKYSKIQERYLKIADMQKRIDDSHLVRAYFGDREVLQKYEFVMYLPTIGGWNADKGMYTMEVMMKVDGELVSAQAQGNGLIDAGSKAIKKIIGENGGANAKLESFKCKSEGTGTEAVGDTTIYVAKNGWNLYGKQQDSDVVTSALKSMIEVYNKVEYMKEKVR